MMNMDAYQAYRYYLALKLHFTTDSSDVIKHKGRVKSSRTAFAKHEHVYNRIAKAYDDSEIVNFLVSNFVAGNLWGGVFDAESKDTYLTWKKKVEGLSYTFKNDMQKILAECDLTHFDANIIFSSQKNQHPYIIRGYLSKQINIETLVILNKLFGFCDKFDKEIEETFIWPDISRLIRKYSPFLKVDKDKYHAIIGGL